MFSIGLELPMPRQLADSGEIPELFRARRGASGIALPLRFSI